MSKDYDLALILNWGIERGEFFKNIPGLIVDKNTPEIFEIVYRAIQLYNAESKRTGMQIQIRSSVIDTSNTFELHNASMNHLYDTFRLCIYVHW